jgi:hypothetical protein
MYEKRLFKLKVTVESETSILGLDNFWDNKNLINEGNSLNLGNPGAEDQNVV